MAIFNMVCGNSSTIKATDLGKVTITDNGDDTANLSVKFNLQNNHEYILLLRDTSNINNLGNGRWVLLWVNRQYVDGSDSEWKGLVYSEISSFKNTYISLSSPKYSNGKFSIVLSAPSTTVYAKLAGTYDSCILIEPES